MNVIFFQINFSAPLSLRIKLDNTIVIAFGGGGLKTVHAFLKKEKKTIVIFIFL